MQRKLEPVMGDESLKGLNLGKCFGPSTNFRKFILIDLFGDGEATGRRNRQGDHTQSSLFINLCLAHRSVRPCIYLYISMEGERGTRVKIQNTIL